MKKHLLFLLLLLSVTAWGQGIVTTGSGIKVSQLPSASTTGSADKFLLIQSGTTKTITLANWLDAITLPAAQVSGLASVATSGSYGDLLGKPTALPASGGTAATITGTLAATQITGTAATVAQIPTNNNQLTNGAGYQTVTGTVATITGTLAATQITGTAATVAQIPTNNNQLSNGAGYQTVTGTVATITGTLAATQITGTAATVAQIPTNNNQLSNGAGYQTVTGTVATITGTLPATHITGTAATVAQIPTNNSQLTNGAGYQTISGTVATITGTLAAMQITGTAATIAQIPTNNNQLTNGAGYQTVTGTVATITGTLAATQITGTAATIAQIPTNNNQLTNGAGYQTTTGTVATITGTLAATQISGTAATVAQIPTNNNQLTNGAGYQTTTGTVATITGTIQSGQVRGVHFNPSSISSLSLWVCAEDLNLTDGANVTAWTDRSALHNDLTLGDSGTPTFVLSSGIGLPAVKFTASGTSGSALKTGTAFWSGTAMTVFWISRKPDYNAGFFWGTTSGSKKVFGWEGNALIPNGEQAYQVNTAASGGAINYGSSDITEPTMRMCSYDGTTMVVRVNGKQLFSSTVSNAAPSGALYIGGLPGATGVSQWNGYIAEYLAFSGTLTAAQISAVENYLQSKYDLRKRSVIFLGDSLSIGVGVSTVATNWTNKSIETLGGKSQWHFDSMGQNGMLLSYMASNMSQWLAPLRNSASSNIFFIEGGINDLVGGATAAQIEGYWASICSAARAAGYKVILSTILPGGTSYETNRLAANSWAIAQGTALADSIADFGGDPVMGSQATQTAQVLYNGLHPNTAGCAYLTPIAADAIAKVAYSGRSATSGTFTTADGKTITIDNGFVKSIQ